MAYNASALRWTAKDRYSAPYDPTISRQWSYKTTDVIATINTANYISDARLRGMSAGDTITVVVMSGATVSAVYTCVVLSIGASGANLSDGVSISLGDAD